MSTEVASTEYGVILYYGEWNTLELKWLPATKDATEAQARDTMALFATEPSSANRGSSSWTRPSSSTGGPMT
jgi:hypothetical protein